MRLNSSTQRRDRRAIHEYGRRQIAGDHAACAIQSYARNARHQFISPRGPTNFQPAAVSSKVLPLLVIRIFSVFITNDDPPTDTLRVPPAFSVKVVAWVALLWSILAPSG